jgi:hypothetical protein
MNPYKWLLHLYPKAFSRQFADDMAADFDDGYAAAKRSRGKVIVAFVARSYADVLRSLLSQWLRTESVVVGGTSVAAGLALWAAPLYVAAHEWPNAPVTSWFLGQVGVALMAGSVLAQSLRRINR